MGKVCFRIAALRGHMCNDTIREQYGVANTVQNMEKNGRYWKTPDGKDRGVTE
jgi:hypothetical protein